MIEKPLIIMIFMYATSFGVLGAQFALADVFGITLENHEGVEIRSNLLDIINIDQINQSTENIATANQTLMGLDPITSAASLVVELFLLLTGTYIFNVLLLFFGVPTIFVAGFVILYFLMLARTIVGYLRGV